MKKTLGKIIGYMSIAFILGGCATAVPIGTVYTGVKLPVLATAIEGNAPKVGMATCTSVLSMFAWGDASINTAKKNGGISKVHHVDWEASNILGLYGKYTVIVYGE